MTCPCELCVSKVAEVTHLRAIYDACKTFAGPNRTAKALFDQRRNKLKLALTAYETWRDKK